MFITATIHSDAHGMFHRLNFETLREQHCTHKHINVGLAKRIVCVFFGSQL